MSSAIEVLKDLKKRIRRRNSLSKDGSEERTLTLNQYEALGEALLALEQKEKLREWLEKEIRNCNDALDISLPNTEFEVINNLRYKLKEVLGELK
jgi:hypothetical protein